MLVSGFQVGSLFASGGDFAVLLGYALAPTVPTRPPFPSLGESGLVRRATPELWKRLARTFGAC